MSTPQIVKVNGRDPSKDKKVISFNIVEENALVGGSRLPLSLQNMRSNASKGMKPLSPLNVDSQEEDMVEDI